MKRVSITLILALLPCIALAGTWQRLRHAPPVPEIIDPTNGDADLGPGGAAFPMLMTDGSVIIQNVGFFGADGKIFKLTPDKHGSYVEGTWSELATMPYVGVAGASAMLPDGRVIIEGGEYSNYEEDFLLTNQGAIYDPVTDSWTTVPPPPFFVDLYPPRAIFAPSPIGDSQSVVLADGTFMLADKMSRQAALLDARTLTWTETGTSTKADMNDEEGWTLLPDGRVLTIDCYTDYHFGLITGPFPKDATHSELYDPTSGQWNSAGSTLNTLTDPFLSEMGMAMLRPDGTVFAVGSEGYSSIYDSRTGRWSKGPRLPRSPQGFQYTAQDEAGALLPNGNVLFTASGGSDASGNGDEPGYSGPPVAFFEFDGKDLIKQPTIPRAGEDESGSVNLLVLPTGQVLATDSSHDVEIYTPHDRSHKEAWAPVIEDVPRVLSRGQTYTLTGIRLNGMSQGSFFGDEAQDATNYPLLRLTSLTQSGVSVTYARSHDFSSMAVQSDSLSSMQFDVPAGMPTGLAFLEVVTNGIPSRTVVVDITH
ncbi:MAG TPA: hypothetical protein VGM16_09430 [Gammaproteobacteria bacterium]|jgi:hypothetical protein